MKGIYLIIGIIILASVTAVGCSQPSTSPQNTYVDVTAAEAKALIDDNPDIIIIDVSPDYLQGHVPGAVNYYIADGSLTEAIPTLDKDRTYLVYCTMQAGSVQGAQELIDAGFENVYRLNGNFQAWVDAGYPVEQGYPPE